MNECIEMLSRNYHLSPKSVAKLISNMQLRSFRKGEYIVTEGERDSNLYIIKSGIWRSFRLNNGNEFTVWFSTEASIAFSIWGYFSNQPARMSIESETDSTAYYIPKSVIDKLCSDSIDIANLMRNIFEFHALDIENDILMFSDNISARNRYLYMLKRTPELLQYVPLKKIASYLFITPQSLSRIRRSIK